MYFWVGLRVPVCVCGGGISRYSTESKFVDNLKLIES